MTEPKLIIVMGVSGSGKSTIAAALADQLGFQFIEADDFHSSENIKHMASGKPLTDEMREPWIENLCQTLKRAADNGVNCVLSFSGLRASHRAKIRDVPMQVSSFHLRGTKDLIERRMSARHGHFMQANLLNSQFDALEDPKGEPNTHSLNIDCSVDELLNSVNSILKLKKTSS